MNNKFKNNYTKYLKEFAILVFGILLAFQLDRFAVERNQQSLVQEHLKYLKEESELNLALLDDSIELAEENLAQIDSLMHLIAMKGDTREINIGTFKLMNVGYLYIRKNAYRSFLESGDIRFLKSFDDKRKIVDLYEYYRWTESFDESHIAAFRDDLFPYMKANFDLVSAQTQQSDIYYNKTFINALATYRQTLDLKLKKYRECKQKISSFIKQMFPSTK